MRHKRYSAKYNAFFYIMFGMLLISITGCATQFNSGNMDEFNTDFPDDPENPEQPDDGDITDDQELHPDEMIDSEIEPEIPIEPSDPIIPEDRDIPEDDEEDEVPEEPNDCVDNDRDGSAVSGSCLGDKQPDCDDNNPYIHTLRMCYPDIDSDGFGAGEKVQVCVGVGVNNHNDLPDVPYGELLTKPGCSVPYYYRYGNITQFPQYPYPYGEQMWHAGSQGYYQGADKYSNYAEGWYSSESWKYSENNRDCMPNDPKAHPWSPYFRETDRGDGSFDYDCDGKITKHYACYVRAYGDVRRQWSGECRDDPELMRTVELCKEPYLDTAEKQWYQENGPRCDDGGMQRVWLCTSTETVDGESIGCGESFYMTAYHTYHVSTGCTDEKILVLDTGLMWSRYLEANGLVLPQGIGVWKYAEEQIRTGQMPLEHARYIQMCR